MEGLATTQIGGGCGWEQRRGLHSGREPVVELEVIPCERDPPLGQQRAHDDEALLEDRHPLAVVEAENLELPFDCVLDDVPEQAPRMVRPFERTSRVAHAWAS